MKHHKKGFMDLVPSNLVKLLLAIILIGFVTYFGVQMGKAMFGNSEKNNKQSLEILYSLIESKSRSTAVYESTAVGLYLDNGYSLQIFDSDKNSACINRAMVMHRPTFCNNKPCVCLYKGLPGATVAKADTNVISCKLFTREIIFDQEKDPLCEHPGKNFAVIVAKEEKGVKDVIHVWNNNDLNREKDLKLRETLIPLPAPVEGDPDFIGPVPPTPPVTP